MYYLFFKKDIHLKKKCGGSGITSLGSVLYASLRVEPAGSHPALSATFQKTNAEGAGFEPAEQLPVRQFSKLVVSATHPSLRLYN